MSDTPDMMMLGLIPSARPVPDPLDLASLPCPLGCRWEYRGIEAIQYVLLCGDVWLGRVWHRHGETEWTAEGDGYRRYAVTNRIEDGINALFHALGLTPAPAADLDAQLAAMSEEARAAFAAKYGWDKAAPAGRTFTEPEVRVLMQGAWRHGFLRGKAKYPKKNPPHMPDLMEKDITAAIAAATDAGKDEPR